MSVTIIVVGAKTKRSLLRITEVANKGLGKGIVEAKVEALVENLAVALMQADNLAADSPEYGVLAETLAYALDLADLGLSAESDVFDYLQPPKPR